MTTPDPETTHEATVERILPGGVGLALVDERAFLLPATAPGDVVVLGFRDGRARVLRLVEPGPDRVVPVCQDVDTCGGCDLMHLAYPAQLEAKRGVLEDCLRRIAKLPSWPEVEVIGSPAEVGYRWRAAFHVAGDGTLGYMGRRSSAVVPIRRCHVLHPALEEWRSGFDAHVLATGARVSAMTDGERVSVAPDGGQSEVLTVTVGGEGHLAAADGFFQANGALVDRLVCEVVRLAEAGTDDGVLDLFAGVGLFSIPLARLARSVTAVESDARATELMGRQLRASGLANVDVRRGRVELALGDRRAGLKPDVVILDPPRAGAGPEVVRRVARLTPRRVVMVSCDPATFARDIRTFADAGYALRELLVLDMFPQTHHLEVVGSLIPV